MTQPLQTLLAAHPRAVAAINRWIGIPNLGDRSAYSVSEVTREYAYKHDIDKDFVGLSSLEHLLGLIESKAAAEAPLSDAEIEGMKWTWAGTCVGPIGFVSFHAYNGEHAAKAVESHNADIDRCHREIKRLRGGGK